MTQPGDPTPDVCALCHRRVPIEDRGLLDEGVMCPLVQLPENAPYRPQTKAGELADEDATGRPAEPPVVPVRSAGPTTVLGVVHYHLQVAEEGPRKVANQLFLIAGLTMFVTLSVVLVVTATVAGCVAVMVVQHRLGLDAWSVGAGAGATTSALLIVRSLVGRRRRERGR